MRSLCRSTPVCCELHSTTTHLLENIALCASAVPDGVKAESVATIARAVPTSALKIPARSTLFYMQHSTILRLPGSGSAPFALTKMVVHVVLIGYYLETLLFAFLSIEQRSNSDRNLDTLLVRRRRRTTVKSRVVVKILRNEHASVGKDENNVSCRAMPHIEDRFIFERVQGRLSRRVQNGKRILSGPESSKSRLVALLLQKSLRKPASWDGIIPRHSYKLALNARPEKQ